MNDTEIAESAKRLDAKRQALREKLLSEITESQIDAAMEAELSREAERQRLSRELREYGESRRAAEEFKSPEYQQRLSEEIAKREAEKIASRPRHVRPTQTGQAATKTAIDSYLDEKARRDHAKRP